MNPAPSSAAPQHRFERAVERRIAGLFWKSAITTDTGSCARGAALPREPPRRHRNAKSSRDDRGQPRQQHGALDRNQVAVVVEPIELGEPSRAVVWYRLAGVGVEAAHHDPARAPPAHPARRPDAAAAPAMRACSSAIALFGVLPPAAREQVVEDQTRTRRCRRAGRHLALGLLGRHVLDGADDRRRPRRVSVSPWRAAAQRRQRNVVCRRRAASPVERAIPKSMISASPSPSIMMFAGLRSRCTTPAACAATSPDDDLPRDAQDLGIGSGRPA